MSTTITQPSVEPEPVPSTPAPSTPKAQTSEDKGKGKEVVELTDETTDTVRVPATPIRPSANTRSRTKLDYPPPHLRSLSDASYQVKDGAYEVISVGEFSITNLRRIVDQHSDDRNRRFHALVLAKEIFGRLPINPKPTPTRVEEIFVQELESLKHITSGVLVFVPSLDANMILLDDQAHDLLYFDLEKRLRQAIPSLQSKGLDMPTIPRWGYEQYQGMVYKINDFEILAVRYREEVENFLTFLIKNHSFDSGIPASPIQFHFNKLYNPRLHRQDPPETPVQRARSTNPSRQRQLSPIEETQETIREFTKPVNPVFRTEHEGVSRGLHDYQKNQATYIHGGRPVPSKISSIFGEPEHNISFNKRKELFNTPNFKNVRDESSHRSDFRNRTREADDEDEVVYPYHQSNEREYFESNLPKLRKDPRQTHNNFSSDNDDPAEDRPQRRRGPPPRGPPGEPDDGGSSDGNNGRNRGNGRRERGQRIPFRHNNTLNERERNGTNEPRFDLKLKPTDVPEWDGDPDALGRWLIKINALAIRSTAVFKELGVVIPTRLTKAAERWYYSLSEEQRRQAETSWNSMRREIASYWINRAWAEKQRTRARDAAYRVQRGCHYELPSEYYIRKYELLKLVFDMSDSELIMQIMNGAPSEWNAILTTHLFDKVEDLQRAIKYHEETLIKTGRPIRPQEGFRNQRFYPNRTNDNSLQVQPSRYGQNDTVQVRAHLVGWSPNLGKPLFPKDDTVISKGKTPEDKGARPCRYCGSGKHWDNDCKHAKSGAKRARVNLVNMNTEDLQAQDEYDELYYESSDQEEPIHEMDERRDF